MKIKKIFMTGFKSFMDRQEVTFPDGLSAIVGPNGSGKSNIVDAIRWALGEQSAKLLRGRNMEDVIFGGADGFKPLGMAEVSVVFENGDGSFPPEFSHQTELSVTRRLYRSGESEYLLNNVPCRLKDIQEIFMDTGLGNRTYSIIGQGKISDIIEQRPEETRAMLEEAAGITKYKKKVEEARRKIELTKGNLQRVEDILVEVERQMRSLKRQAGKARRYKEISREIQRLELILSAHAYQDLTQKAGDQGKSLEELVREELSLNTAFSGIQARLQAMGLELEEKDKRISGLKETYFQLKDRVHQKEASLESMAIEKRMQEEMKDRLEKEREELGKKLTRLREERERILEKIEGVRRASDELEEQISTLEERIKGRQALLKEAREVYEEARTRVHSRTSKEMSLAQESGYLNDRIREITDSRTRLEKEKEEIERKLETVARAGERKAEVRQALMEKLQAIEQDLERKREEVDELTRLRQDLEAKLRVIDADLNRYGSRLATLRSMSENFEGFKIGVRTVMKASELEAHREGRIIGLVADILGVPPEYEQAVESVLGDKLQYVIVESQRDGKEAVYYLKEKKRGKSSFVPLAELKGNGLTEGKNGHPLLRDLVSVPQQYKKLADILLGNAVLVEDLEQAVAEWSANGKDHCLVTRDGDMVDASGIISGGALANSSRGILGRKREIHELQEKVNTLEKSKRDLEDRLGHISIEIEKNQELLEELTQEKSNCQERITDLDKENFRLSHEMDQLERLSERILEELERKGREQNRHREALEKIHSELEQCKEIREQEEAFFHEKEFELRESEEELDRYREELSGLKTSHSRIGEEERGLRREVERIDDFTLEAEERIDRIGDEISESIRRFKEYTVREEVLREELGRLYTKLEDAKENVGAAERERNILWSKIHDKEKKSEELRGLLEEVKEKIHLAKMEQSEIKFKIEALVESCREKFNLDLPQAYRSHLVEDFSLSETKERLEHQKRLKERLGEVNLTAIQEHEALKERHQFIVEQKSDLLRSMDSLNQAIRKINKTSLEKFMKTFREVDEKLKEVFPILFNGGTAALKLVDETRPLESGVLVEVQPPGKKLSHMGLLSGGEKALVAMALLFSMYLIKPSPFCLLDEVDAPLDEANVDRFNNLLREIGKFSQIIMVTHSRKSMEIADRLYGVTMEKKGVSKLVSVNLEKFRSDN
ncbi:MAG: chromosome segregation protein SMC [Deltaproteobacteria bacterium]|nr:chromosome segregation protein SMC [Deltaproteobacteria bacterium]MBW2303768.1 chromosome segregation protein SMC [Deltaproteobacteria bacterium]